MRYIKACYLYIRLVLTPGFRLAFKTLGIIRLGSLKFHQEISGIRKSFKDTAKSYTLYISPFTTTAFSARILAWSVFGNLL